MSIRILSPRNGVQTCQATYRSLSQAHAKSNAAAVSRPSAMTPMSLRSQTGPNTPRSRGLSKQPHTSPASQGQANDTLPDGCQGSLSLRLALLRRSSTRFSNEIDGHTERLNRKVGSSHPTVLRPELNDRQCEPVAVGQIHYSSRLSCFPVNFGEGEV
jgi:hypothetical protein